MQKQESLYYQAQAGAHTVTNAVAMEGAPEFWVTLLRYIHVKGDFRLEDI